MQPICQSMDIRTDTRTSYHVGLGQLYHSTDVLICCIDDHSRVVLSQEKQIAGEDYINASFIDVRNIYTVCWL